MKNNCQIEYLEQNTLSNVSAKISMQKVFI